MAGLDRPSSDTILACIDGIAAEFAASPWEREVKQAREEFDGRRGRVYDDEDLFAGHVAAFLEWYVLERSLPDGRPPIAHLLERSLGSGTGERSGALALERALAVSHRSLFEIVAFPAGALRLLDLIGGGLWRAERPSTRDGLDLADIFEGRVIPWAGRVILGPTCCFHPREARSCIHQLVQRGSGPELVFELAQMRLRHSRFRNFAIRRIYTRDLRTPV
jgi:hypothetical protein